jgi:hypothetical protein
MRRLLLPAIATAVALAILVGLGVWQVERLAWKEGLIARVTARLDAPAGPAPPPSAWGRLDLADLQYEPVAVTGRFDNRHEIHVVQALTEPKGRLGGLGYMVMTPLTTADGWTVYVNRGFVPADHKDRRGLVLGLGLTVILGLCFTGVQAYEYAHAAFSFGGTIYGATFFMATGFHGFHVIIGTIFLIVCFIRAYRGQFDEKHHFGFEAAAWYWHFVDVVWLFLFFCIYIWGGWGAAIEGATG